MDEERITCELCGKEIPEGSGEEIYDGYICEDCALKLSPFASDLELSEVEDLEEQLELRQQNLHNLESFRPTRSFYLPGMTEKVYLDDGSRTFLVTEDGNLRKENPDLISLDEVLDAKLIIDDNRETIGDHLYRYTYDLSMNICLDHPYIDEITFLLNREPLEFESEEKSFLGFGGFDPESQEGYRYVESFGQDLSDALMECEEEINHRYDVKPGEFQLEAEEAPDRAAVPEEGDTVVCPWCGSRTTVGADFCCSHCGGNL